MDLSEYNSLKHVPVDRLRILIVGSRVLTYILVVMCFVTSHISRITAVPRELLPEGTMGSTYLGNGYHTVGPWFDLTMVFFTLSALLIVIRAFARIFTHDHPGFKTSEGAFGKYPYSLIERFFRSWLFAHSEKKDLAKIPD